jgi:hypothetical protein
MRCVIRKLCEGKVAKAIRNLYIIILTRLVIIAAVPAAAARRPEILFKKIYFPFKKYIFSRRYIIW